MNKSSKTLAEVLLRAIKAERDGISFYMMAANSTEDFKGKQIFEGLALEEKDHMEFLTSQYNSFLKTGKMDLSKKLGTPKDLSESWPIFSESIRTRLKSSHFEMSALSIGIQLEQDAMTFYRTQSETIEEPDVKKLFATLADWETGHYRALLSQQQALSDDYWAMSGFSPF